jgi:hypothetical protein
LNFFLFFGLLFLSNFLQQLDNLQIGLNFTNNFLRILIANGTFDNKLAFTLETGETEGVVAASQSVGLQEGRAERFMAGSAAHAIKGYWPENE